MPVSTPGIRKAPPTWRSATPTSPRGPYQEVIDHDGSGITGQMARLGLAEAQARAGQYDQAIKTFMDLAQRKEGPLPIDGILMQLGRTYRDAGKPAEAQQTFNRLVDRVSRTRRSRAMRSGNWSR